jgi:hypothetical protein
MGGRNQGPSPGPRHSGDSAMFASGNDAGAFPPSHTCSRVPLQKTSDNAPAPRICCTCPKLDAAASCRPPSALARSRSPEGTLPLSGYASSVADHPFRRSSHSRFYRAPMDACTVAHRSCLPGHHFRTSWLRISPFGLNMRGSRLGRAICTNPSSVTGLYNETP